MEIQSKYKTPFPEMELQVIETLDFPGFPVLNLEQDVIGNKYLSYLSSLKNDIEQRYIIQVSDDRLKKIYAGELTLKNAFNDAENRVVFVYEFKKNGAVKGSYLIPIVEFTDINPIENDYVVPPPQIQAVEINEGEFINYSIRKGKPLIDIYIQSGNLVNNIKPYAIYNILVPTVEILKSFFDIDQRGVNQRFAFSNLRTKSFGFTIEITEMKPELFTVANYRELDNLIRLFNAREKKDFESIVEQTRKEKYIGDYSKIINAIIDNDATMRTAYANPNTKTVVTSNVLDKNSAKLVKNIIDESFDTIEDIENIKGIFLDINVATKEPSFVIGLSGDNATYKGKIELSLLQKIKSDFINSGKVEYLFTVKTIFHPRTTVASEKLQRFLIDYKKLD